MANFQALLVASRHFMADEVATLRRQIAQLTAERDSLQARLEAERRSLNAQLEAIPAGDDANRWVRLCLGALFHRLALHHRAVLSRFNMEWFIDHWIDNFQDGGARRRLNWMVASLIQHLRNAIWDETSTLLHFEQQHYRGTFEQI